MTHVIMDGESAVPPQRIFSTENYYGANSRFSVQEEEEKKIQPRQ